jgi:hypothetical protein
MSTGSIQSCLALNGLVKAVYTTDTNVLLNRVGTQIVTGRTMTNNWAYSGMALKKILHADNAETPVNATSDLNGLDGFNCAEKPAQTDYVSLGWDFADVWQFTGDYPTLRGFSN